MRQKVGKESTNKKKPSQMSADDMERLLGFRPFGVEW